MRKQPLSELRVVELGSGDALGYCGKLFADFGAEVIKIEPPGGDPERRLAPLVDAGDGRRESAVFGWLNTNKRSVTADSNSDEGVARIRALLKHADLLLDGRLPREIETSHLTHDDLNRRELGLAITSLSWFGAHGPYRDYHATDSVCRSLAGLVKLVGSAEGPPVLPRDGQIGVMAGLTAFIPTLAGLYGRHNGARRYSVSALQAMLQISEFDTGLALEAGFTRPRIALNRFGRGFPVGNFKTKNGWLGVTVVTPAQWVAFCDMIGLPELGPDPRYSATADRYTHATELGRIIEPVLAKQTTMHWFDQSIALRLPLAAVPEMDELLTQQVYRDRGAFAPVQIGTASFDAPVLPQHLTGSPPTPNGRAPFAGEDDGKTLPDHARSATRAATLDDPQPLKGVRIVDLTMGWAGPSATRQMGDLGADVIKVESTQYPDWFRGTDPRGAYHPERTYEKTYWFQMMNRNKSGITLDLTNAKGLALLKQLLADADAVIDNYAADVLPRMGLDAKAMHAINPRLVVVTMPAFGMTGAWSGVRAYGSTLEQASGLPSVTGNDSDPPTMVHAALGDPVGGVSAAAALMLGLMHQKITGQGQHIDLSAVEALLPLVAPSIIEQSASGRSSKRIGNRHPRFAPHGCFPCLGDDQWITVAVQDDAQWLALCGVIRRPDLAKDPTLTDARGRRSEQDRIEVALRQWTTTVRPDLAMVTLQAAGIAAGVARLPADLPGDPHLVAAGHWQAAVRPFMGPHLLPSVAWREAGDPRPPAITRLAPTLGQHNADVLRERLGIGDDDLRDLENIGIIGTSAVSKQAKAKSSSA